MDDDYSYLFKIILIGDSGVGKTNLFRRIQNQEFNIDSRPTIGVEFINKCVRYSDHIIKCQVWDTAGQEKFRAITNAYYRGAKGAFVCFDVTKQQTFESCSRWLSEIRQYGDPNIVVTLVGNKVDLVEQRIINSDEVSQFCEQNNVGFIETSAMTNQNVDKAFQWIIEEIYKHNSNNQVKSTSSLGHVESIPLNLTQQKEKKQCC